jgi:hypothetical protein
MIKEIDELSLNEEELKEYKLKSSVFFIEATHNEQFNIWKENKHIFKQDNCGFGQTIGFIKDNKNMPVVVSFTFAYILDQRVCFYEATSRFVDHNMVEKFLKTNYPVKWDYGNRDAYTNADNFDHVIHHCNHLKFKDC